MPAAGGEGDGARIAVGIAELAANIDFAAGRRHQVDLHHGVRRQAHQHGHAATAVTARALRVVGRAPAVSKATSAPAKAGPEPRKPAVRAMIWATAVRSRSLMAGWRPGAGRAAGENPPRPRR